MIFFITSIWEDFIWGITSNGSTINNVIVCYDIENVPTTQSNTVISSSLNGNISVDINNLKKNTKYRINVCFIDELGECYSQEFASYKDGKFPTWTFHSEIMGYFYHFTEVVAGDSVSVENIRMDRYYATNDPIQLLENQDDWNNATEGRCYLNNDPEKRNLYGDMFKAATLRNPNFAPPEVEIMDDAAFVRIINEYGTSIGAELKGPYGWKNSDNTEPNPYNFNALAGGWRSTNGFGGEGEAAVWWKSNIAPFNNSTWAAHIDYDSDKLENNESYDNHMGFYARWRLK